MSQMSYDYIESDLDTVSKKTGLDLIGFEETGTLAGASISENLRLNGIFDHDGTLANSEEPALTSAWGLTNRLLSEASLDGIQKDEFLVKYAGKPYLEILKQVQNVRPTFNVGESRLAELVHQEEMLAREALRKEVQETAHTGLVLGWLKGVDSSLAMATSSQIGRIAACFERTRQDEFFPLTDGSDNRVFSAIDSLPERNPKPAPDVYKLAMQSIGVDPNADFVFAVEDTPTGVLSAKNAGIKNIVGFVGGGNIPKNGRVDRANQLAQAGAVDVIEDMIYLPAVLLELGAVKIETELAKK